MIATIRNNGDKQIKRNRPIILIIIRVRQRMVNRKTKLDMCPDCGGSLHRIHKNNLQELFAKLFLIRIKNYTCMKCSFTGKEMKYLKPKKKKPSYH